MGDVRRVAGLTRDSEMIAAYRLRAAVYVHEQGFLPAAVLHDGLESDDLDGACRHGGVFDGDDLVGYLRLIPASRGLPVSSMFGVTVEEGGVEVSRLILSATHRSSSSLIPLLGWAVQSFYEHNDTVVYAVVEEWLLEVLQSIGFPFETIAGPIDVYNTANIAVACPVESLAEGVSAADQGRTRQLAAMFQPPARVGARL